MQESFQWGGGDYNNIEDNEEICVHTVNTP